MAGSNYNILLIILVIIIIAAIFYYINKNNQRVPPNVSHFKNNISNEYSVPKFIKLPTVNDHNEFSDNIVDTLLSNYDHSENNTLEILSESPSQYYSTMSPFNHVNKKQHDTRNMDYPFSDEECDDRDFTYKKHKFTKRTPDDLNDLFDVSQMLPKEIEDDWWDNLPLDTTKKINGTHMINPKHHMGIDTVGNSKRNATTDPRGEIPNPKISVSPWGNSTIEPNPYARGLCN
ncbi:hypothetical protein QLL95_gp1076 [Cotonvirus japonicus]|uniref:Minor capsid protein P11 C-terminal conserved region domain-containing protein n=1 Tax=Cotonvirus japonicus TaxID=2811091 RepID=A0ABM7NSH6_9VIRU|nr:hypothetical protein QLL95_gp1076 [Cotonvirus japonicus]BCS83047.1 hypothetical protein [Cotonvirus japonicus]